MDIFGRGVYYKAKKFVAPKQKRKKQSNSNKLFKKLF